MELTDAPVALPPASPLEPQTSVLPQMSTTNLGPPSSPSVGVRSTVSRQRRATSPPTFKRTRAATLLAEANQAANTQRAAYGAAQPATSSFETASLRASRSRTC